MSARFEVRVGCDFCDAIVFRASPVPPARLADFRLTARAHLLNNEMWLLPCTESPTGHHVIRQTETPALRTAVRL